MEIKIENIHEAWEVKRALKMLLAERNKTIDNLQLEEKIMHEVGVSKEITDTVISKRIASLKCDQATCAALIKKISNKIYGTKEEK